MQETELTRKEAELTRAEETIRREQQQIQEMRQRVSLVCGATRAVPTGAGGCCARREMRRKAQANTD